MVFRTEPSKFRLIWSGLPLNDPYLHYEIPSGFPGLPILTFIGFAIMFGWKEWFAPATIVALLGGHWGNMTARFIMVLFAMVIWPVVITVIVRNARS